MDAHQDDELLFVLDPANGAVLKYDISDPSNPQLEDFAALGSPAITEYDDGGSPVPLALSADADLAVDDSGGPNDGTIYVATGPSSLFATDGKLFAFSADGQFLYEVTNGAGSINVTGLDVVRSGDRAGDLFLFVNPPFTAPAKKVQHWVDQPGTAPPIYDDPSSFNPVGSATGAQRLAVNSEGDNIYTAGGLTRYSPDGTAQKQQITTTAPLAISVDPNTDHVYATYSDALGGARIEEYSGAGDEHPDTLLDSFGAGDIGPTASGVIVLGSSSTVFATDMAGHVVDVFVPGQVPDLEVGEAEFDSLTSARLSGTVNPLGSAVTSCEFHYGTTTNYGQSVPCEPADLGSGDEPLEVSAIATGLSGATNYHFRLEVTNADGENVSADRTYFAPNLPEATTAEAGPVGSRSGTALLGGTVDANDTPTNWWIEYGVEADLSDAQSSPPGEDLDLGDGTDPIDVSHQVKGLEADTTYYFRVVAATAAGRAEGTIRSFEMPAAPDPNPNDCPNADYRRSGTPSSFLPECRAYERVTPFETGGGSMVPDFDATTPDGNRVTYYAETAFAGADTLGVLDAYVANRGTNGWTTESVVAPGVWNTSQTVGNWAPHSSDIGLQHFSLTNTNINLPGASVDGLTLAQRDPGGRWNVVALNSGLSYVSKTIPDGSGIITEGTNLPVTDGPAPPVDKAGIYKFSNDGSESELVSIDENGDPLVTSGGTFTNDRINVFAAGAGRRDATSSVDGSRIFFKFSQGFPTKDSFWVRIDGERTQLVTKSEVSPAPDVPASRWWGITGSGEFAFFSTAAQLTVDSNAAPNSEDLYRYDVDQDDLVDLTTGDPGGAGLQRVLGFSADGQVAYFEATGNLTPDADGNDVKVYRADGDGVTLIAEDITTSPSAQFENQYAGQVSPDGRYLLFNSASRYNVFDPGGKRELYRYDNATGRIDCVSCSISGAVPDDDAYTVFSDARARAVGGGPGFRLDPRLRLTPDGKVIFATANALVPRDTNNEFDVYMWDGEPRLISSGKDVTGAWPLAVSADGSSIFLISRDRLVGSDTDNRTDLYVARVNGGFEAQQYPDKQDAPCHGPACRDDEPSPPSTFTPGTEGDVGGSGPNCKAEQRKLQRAEQQASKAERNLQRKQRQANKIRRKARRADGKRAQKLRKRAKEARRQAKRLGRKAERASKREERAARRASRCVNGGGK